MITMMGTIPLTHATTRTALDFASCGLLQRVAWARSIAIVALAISLADAATTILNVSSYVHLLSKHGCKILVAFLEVH
jgi:hypothetical protein